MRNDIRTVSSVNVNKGNDAITDKLLFAFNGLISTESHNFIVNLRNMDCCSMET